MHKNILDMQHKDYHSHTTGNIGVAFWLNFAFTVIALICGFALNSNAILSESIHNLGCTFTIGSAWFFQYISSKKQFDSLSFGSGRIPLLGAIISAIVLSVSSILVLLGSVSAIEHNHTHGDIMAEGMIWLSLIGILIKGLAAYKTKNAKGENEKLVSVHMFADTMGWIAILITGIILLFKDVPIIDSALSIAISAYILVNVVNSLINTFNILLDRVPTGLSIKTVRELLYNIKEIKSIGDIKLWSIDGELHAAIIQVTPTVYNEEVNKKIKSEIKQLLTNLNITEIFIEFV